MNRYANPRAAIVNAEAQLEEALAVLQQLEEFLPDRAYRLARARAELREARFHLLEAEAEVEHLYVWDATGGEQ